MNAEALSSEPIVVRAAKRVGEIMSWSVHTVDVRATCRDARRVAAERRVHHLPVTDGGVLVGMLCTCDLYEAAETETVAARMHTPVWSVNTLASSDDVIGAMRRHSVGALPVTYHGFLVGIVSIGDLARAGLINRRPTCAACGAQHHVRPTAEGLRCLACRLAASARAG